MTTSMQDVEIVRLSGTELARAIRRRELSSVEVVEIYLRRIESVNPSVNAYVDVLADEARAQAELADRSFRKDVEPPPLLGVPVAVKDLEAKGGAKLTFGSVPLRDNRAAESDPFVQRLEQAGAIVLGKTNTPEFGQSGTTDNRLFGPTSTPFDLSKNSGGSSGGSAAAVVSGLAAIAQGSDGGGSIRIPASLCGALGFKASWGRIPMKIRPQAFMHTPFVHVGPITRTVADAALMVRVMAGPHAADPFSLPADESLQQRIEPLDLNGLRVGYSPTFGGFPVDPAVRDVIAHAARTLQAHGASVDEVEPRWGYEPQTLGESWLQGAAVLNAGIAETWRRAGVDLLGEHADELTEPFRESAELGRKMSALDYRLGDVMRAAVLDVLEEQLAVYDFILTPTTGVASVENNPGDGMTYGPTKINGVDADPLIGWILTFPVNFTGHPAVSVPAGVTADGHPVGLHVIGRRFADRDLLALCAALEQILPWRDRYDDVLAKLG